MSRDLLLLLLGTLYPEPFAFDDDDDPDDPDGGDGDPDPDGPDDPEGGGKEESKNDPKKPAKTESPEALKKQVADLQKKLKEKNSRIADLARDRAKLNRQVKGGGKAAKKDADDPGGDDTEVTKLRQTVTELTERLDDLSSENFIEKNVIRKLQPLITAGLDEAGASRKLNAAMKLVDSEEDFDDDGNFDAVGFLERYPYLAVESDGKEDATRERLLGGSGKKAQSKKDYAKDRIQRFNDQRNRRSSTQKGT